jgi:hypothetical protein
MDYDVTMATWLSGSGPDHFYSNEQHSSLGAEVLGAQRNGEVLSDLVLSTEQMYSQYKNVTLPTNNFIFTFITGAITLNVSAL